jgi:hypothetical protein
MWPAFPTPDYYDPLRLPLGRPPHFPGSPVIGGASLPATPQTGGAETALPGSQDDHPHVQRPIRRRVPQRPLLDQERFPWPSPWTNRLGTPSLRLAADLSDDACSGFTCVADRAVDPAPLRTRPLGHARGLHYRGPRRLPGPDSHRQAALNLSLLGHADLLFLMAPEQSRRTRPTQQRAGASSGAVESPGGFAPPGARRSRREPLDSPGSCHPAVGCAPDAQCANRPRSRLAIAARNRAVRVGWPRNRLYFRMAQRIRYLLMSLRVWISSVR